MTGLEGSGRHFDDLRVGETFRRSLTITDTHLVVGAGLIGDFNPHHVDDGYAAGSRFGTRILHGVLTAAIMGGALGMAFHGTAIAYLGQDTKFTAPVRAGDTLTTTWTVTGLDPKPKHGGGVVTLEAQCVNQRGEVVATATGRMLVQAAGKRSSTVPSPPPARARTRRPTPARGR